MTLGGLLFWIIFIFWLIPLPFILHRFLTAVPALIILVVGDNLIVAIGSTLLLRGRQRITKSIREIPVVIEYVFFRER